MGDNQFAIELEGAASLIAGKAWKFETRWRYSDRRAEGGGRPRPIMIMSRSMIRSVRGGGRRSAIGNRTGKKQTLNAQRPTLNVEVGGERRAGSESISPRLGVNVGSSFWSCSGFPKCRGTREIYQNSKFAKARAPSPTRGAPIRQAQGRTVCFPEFGREPGSKLPIRVRSRHGGQAGARLCAPRSSAVTDRRYRRLGRDPPILKGSMGFIGFKYYALRPMRPILRG